ncbi:MAG TPA: hypothetical protein VEK08_14015 [Planctomycetota bacterium]|nr:hypothetical protein [Planctomycetota bacterium]
MMSRILPILVLAAVAWPACACTLPLFRSALETGEPDLYQAVIYSRGPQPEDVQSLQKKALGDTPSNLRVTIVDVDSPSNPDALKLWKEHGSPTLPWMAVTFPREGKLAWCGALDEAASAALLESPAQKQLRQHLLGGTSAVWLLLESGDTARDDKIAAFLQTHLTDLAKRLKLPVVAPEQLRSSLPLKLEFSVVRVPRAAPEEKFFTAQLLQQELNPKQISLEQAEPLVFPVFGRGRAMPAMTEKELLPETIAETAQFLSSSCSCEVKELTPGTSLLLAADWEKELTTGRNQRVFIGIITSPSPASPEHTSDVVGMFTTARTDKNPGRNYLIKIEKNNTTLLGELQRSIGRDVQVAGTLQEFGPDGQAKYLILDLIKPEAATKPLKERRKGGGI